MSVSQPDVEFEIAGVNAVLMRFSDHLDPELPAYLDALRHLLLNTYGDVIQQAVPAFTTMLVKYDPRQCRLYDLQLLLERAISEVDVATHTARHGRNAAVIEIPVVYGGDYGPDLDAVAEQAKLSRDEVIQLHSQTTYQVYAQGFAPGFSYLGSLPEAIRLPRRATPRERIPAGSVAIAEQQTAVYPNASPGGWHIIGFSPIRWFDVKKTPMTPVQVGDQVRFVVIQPEELKNWQEAQA